MGQHPDQRKPAVIQRRENLEEVNILLTMAKQFGYELASEEQAAIRQRVYDLLGSPITAIVPKVEVHVGVEHGSDVVAGPDE